MKKSLEQKQRYLDFDSLFGIELAKMREENGLSQEAVAEVFGVARSVISKIEHGSRKLEAREIGDYADAMQVDYYVICGVFQRIRAEYDAEAARRRLLEEEERLSNEGA